MIAIRLGDDNNINLWSVDVNDVVFETYEFPIFRYPFYSRSCENNLVPQFFVDLFSFSLSPSP